MKKAKLSIEWGIVCCLLIILSACARSSEDEAKNTDNKETEPNTKTILNSNTLIATASLIEHVTEVNLEKGTILFDKSTPQNELPKKGQILLNGRISPKFPSGFLGKVSQIVQDGNSYKVITTPSSLIEAFDKLYINQECELHLVQDEPNSRTKIDYWSKNIEDGDGYVGRKYGLTVSDSKNNTKFNLDGSLSISMKMICNIDIDKDVKKNYLAFTLQMKPAFNFDLSVKTDSKTEQVLFEKEFAKWRILPVEIPAGAIANLILQPEVSISSFLDTKGVCEFQSSLHAEKEFVTGVLYKDEILSANIKPMPVPETSSFSSSSFSLDGKVHLGLKFAFKCHVLHENIAAIALEGKIGPALSAHISVKSLENSPYEQLKDEKITATMLDTSIGFNLYSNIFLGDNNGIKKDLVNASYLNHSYYLLPTFENMEIKIGNNKDKATVTSTVKHDLLLPVKLGYGLYDEKKELVKYAEEYVIFKNESELLVPLAGIFNNLKGNKTYYVCPTVELPVLGKIKAVPENELIIKKPKQVKYEQKAYIYSAGGWYNGDKTESQGHFLINWNETINLESIEGIVECGTYEVDGGVIQRLKWDLKTGEQTKLIGTFTNEPQITLKRGTYIATLDNNGEYTYTYSDLVDVVLEYPKTISMAFTNSRFLGTTYDLYCTDQEHKEFKCYESISSFNIKIQGAYYLRKLFIYTAGFNNEDFNSYFNFEVSDGINGCSIGHIYEESMGTYLECLGTYNGEQYRTSNRIIYTAAAGVMNGCYISAKTRSLFNPISKRGVVTSSSINNYPQLVPANTSTGQKIHWLNRNV